MKKEKIKRSNRDMGDRTAPEHREQLDSAAGRQILRAHTAVIGAGASGMAAAVAAASASSEGALFSEECENEKIPFWSVAVIDGNDRIGKKLYATGNGRCNFTNEGCRPEEYNNPSDGFVEGVFRRFGTQDTLRYFEKEGLMARLEEGGRYYPYSGQAVSLVKVLERSARKAGCHFILSDKAVSLEEYADLTQSAADEFPLQLQLSPRFVIVLESGRRLYCRNVIIACGGRAGLKTGSTGDGYGFAKSFGHTLAAPHPALTAAESDDPFVADLKGVRARGRVSLYEKEQGFIAAEPGEIQFTGTGISGICVFDLSRFMEAARPPQKKKKKSGDKAGAMESAPQKEYTIVCDFVPEKSREELGQFLVRNMEQTGAGLKEAVSGIVNDRLAAVIVSLAEDGAAEKCGKSKEKMEFYRAVRLLKGLKISVSHTKGWEEAQVTCGGVRRQEIDPATMESKLRKGLYFCGEVIDVDGRCGGYNLQWAWSSGAVAGCAAAERPEADNAGEKENGFVRQR